MQIKETLEKWIKKELEIESPVLVHPKELKNGDYTLIINSGDVEEFAKKLEANLIEEVSKIVFVAPRFINIFLSSKFYSEEILKIDEDYGKVEILKGEKIFIEHTQPNPFKEFHIGHLMNNAIGESVSRILKANGVEVKTCSYHGDVGLHVAKAVYGYFEEQKINKDLKHLINYVAKGAAYVKGNKLYESDENSKTKIVEINKKIYERTDDEINSIYDWGKEISLGYFSRLYERLDCKFDEEPFFESESGEIGKKIVLENVPKVFEKGEEGAVVFRGENFEPKTHTRVFLNKEGLPTYEAKEVGLAKIKKEKFDYNISVTVTANEQDSFFKVVEVAIGEVFPDRKGKLKHLSHGMLKLPEGKMSSRTGNVITAEKMITDVKDKILEEMKDREFREEEKNEIAEIVAIGAIKYSILRQAIGGDIIFDFDKSLSFEGDSGPYLQYAYVRTRSVLTKSEALNPKSETNSEIQIPENWEITEVEKLVYRFPEVVERSALEYAPHHLVTYLTELAGAFNSFYAQNKIIDDSDPTSPYKISLTSAVSHVLKNGLHLLGIKVPERM